jgi:hypothetical protein
LKYERTDCRLSASLFASAIKSWMRTIVYVYLSMVFKRRANVQSTKTEQDTVVADGKQSLYKQMDDSQGGY